MSSSRSRGELTGRHAAQFERRLRKQAEAEQNEHGDRQILRAGGKPPAKPKVGKRK